MDAATASPIFEEVAFVSIPGGNADDLAKQHEVVAALKANGANEMSLRKDNDEIAVFEDITHIISSHVDFPQYTKALDDGILVVKPSWVIQSLRKGKKASERQHSPDPSQFFQDVVVTMGDLPDGDKAAISGGVLALGGQYSNPLSKLTTHLVTMSLDDPKCKIAMEKSLTCQIVAPHWFDDCLKLGKRINERPYVFPDPEIFHADSRTLVRAATPAHMIGATEVIPRLPLSPPRATPPASPSSPRKSLHAFKGKTVMISHDIAIAQHLRDTLYSLIRSGGGKVVDNVDEADILVCQFRDGSDYVTASQAGKEVANLAWLYNVINRNQYTNPTSKLLHYPVPRDPLPGFKDLKISISSYSGDARIYVENLVRHCGAEFTKTMKQDNTHLITAHSRSEKVEAAQEWNINIINHLWLEESYAKCALQPLTNPRYVHFPTRTNLGEIVGKTSLDMSRVEHCFFRQASKVKLPAGQKQTTKSILPIVAVAQQDLNTPAKSVTPGTELVGSEGESIAAPKNPTKKAISARTNNSTPKCKDDEKENESPLVRSMGRASKAKALDVMIEQAQDIAQFQKEMKRKGGVTHGGRRRSEKERESSSPAPATKRPGKRKSDEMTYDATNQDSEMSDGETLQANDPPPKKHKQAVGRSALPPVAYKVVVTGYDRWTDKPRQCDNDKTKLRALGILVTEDHRDVDIIVAPKILRTRKFVCALACAPLVVGTEYLDGALRHHRVDEDPSLLEDRQTEDRLGFKLSDALDRARINAHRLLRGWSIFVTKDITGGFDTYKDIITANGGNAFLYAGRTGLQLPRRRIKDDVDAGGESQNQGGDEEYDFVYLVSGESPSEIKLWKTFRELASKQDMAARIVKSDWLLHAAMSQSIKWDSEVELRED